MDPIRQNDTQNDLIPKNERRSPQRTETTKKTKLIKLTPARTWENTIRSSSAPGSVPKSQLQQTSEQTILTHGRIIKEETKPKRWNVYHGCWNNINNNKVSPNLRAQKTSRGSSDTATQLPASVLLLLHVCSDALLQLVLDSKLQTSSLMLALALDRCVWELGLSVCLSVC